MGGRHDDRRCQAGQHQRIERQEPVLPQLRGSRREMRGGSSPASTLPPSSGGTGIRLKNASSRFTWTADEQRKVQRAGRPSRDRTPRGASGRRQRRPGSRLLTGPAAATNMKSRRGWRRLRMLTGTGFAQPISGRPVTIAISGRTMVPVGIDVHERIQRHTPERARRGIAQPVGRPCVGGLVNGERQQEHAEADGGGDRIDIQR